MGDGGPYDSLKCKPQANGTMKTTSTLPFVNGEVTVTTTTGTTKDYKGTLVIKDQHGSSGAPMHFDSKDLHPAKSSGGPALAETTARFAGANIGHTDQILCTQKLSIKP